MTACLRGSGEPLRQASCSLLKSTQPVGSAGACSSAGISTFLYVRVRRGATDAANYEWVIAQDEEVGFHFENGGAEIGSVFFRAGYGGYFPAMEAATKAAVGGNEFQRVGDPGLVLLVDRLASGAGTHEIEVQCGTDHILTLTGSVQKSHVRHADDYTGTPRFLIAGRHRCG